jgi:hypothetical protein
MRRASMAEALVGAVTDAIVDRFDWRYETVMMDVRATPLR